MTNQINISGVTIVKDNGSRPVFHIPSGMSGIAFKKWKAENKSEIADFLSEEASTSSDDEGDRFVLGQA